MPEAIRRYTSKYTEPEHGWAVTEGTSLKDAITYCPPPTNTPTPTPGPNPKIPLGVGIGLGLPVFLAFVVGIVLYKRKKKPTEEPTTDSPPGNLSAQQPGMGNTRTPQTEIRAEMPCELQETKAELPGIE